MITKAEIERIVSGKFFRVKFTKKDGTVREMTCKLNVRGMVSGNGKPLADDHLFVIEEPGNKAKSLKLDRLTELKCGDYSYTA